MQGHRPPRHAASVTEGRQFETFRGLVQPAQCDVMGHMNVQYYVAAFDQAMWHLTHQIGYRAPETATTGHGWADVRHVIEYRDELRAGALYRIMSRVRRVGRSSLVTFHRLSALGTGALSATCEMTSVYFDLATRASSPLPQSLRDAAAALLPPDRSRHKEPKPDDANRRD
jgi:acyl-CoA thioester hydrolase